MAINRALMNRQMYNMGGPSRPRQMYDMGGSSLQAGAPDLRLTGDVRPTYTQGRKNRMDMAFGGIAGLDGRKRYGIGSWFQETIMDPIKNNPVTSAVIGGGLLNEFGLPDFITEGDNFIGDYFSNDAGKNFLGQLIGKIPGVDKAPEFNLGLGDENSIARKALATILPGGSDGYFDLYGLGGGNEAQQFETDKARDEYRLAQAQQRQNAANFLKASAAGAAAGAYVDSQPKDVLPTDTTKINFQTAQEVMDDPNQRFKPPVEATQLAANGGRIGYAGGMGVSMEKNVNPNNLDELVASYMKTEEGKQELMDKVNQGMSMPDIINQMKKELMMVQNAPQGNMQMQQPQMAAMGGRIGYDIGGPAIDPEYNGWKKLYKVNPGVAEMHDNHQKYLQRFQSEQTPVKKAEGGLMDLGGNEMDLRAEGGFIPIGGKEKADDVPARLSKNEFVFTADAVRNAGGGDIDEGAQVMERLMKSLEQGGQVSEESQGLDGAREMFETSQRLEKRII